MVRRFIGTTRKEVPLGVGPGLAGPDAEGWEKLTGDEEELVLPPGLERQFEQAFEDYARGDVVSGAQLVEELRNGTLVDNVRREDAARARAKRRVVARKPTVRTPRARKRAR